MTPSTLHSYDSQTKYAGVVLSYYRKKGKSKEWFLDMLDTVAGNGVVTKEGRERAKQLVNKMKKEME